MEQTTNQGNEFEIVKPIVEVRDALKDLRAFDDLKSRLLLQSDYQAISGKNFIKKSGWRKLALVFNISDQIVENSKQTRDDDSFVWRISVRATAPNGRFTEAVACCDSRERKFAHIEHDVFATAHTRAKSRAISDLIGAGEISAEELSSETSIDEEQGKEEEQWVHEKKSDPIESTLESVLSQEEQEKARNLLRSASDLSWRASDVQQQVSGEQVAEESVRRFELNLAGRAFHISENEAPFSRFFIGKICKAAAEHNPGSRYELEKDERGRVSAILWYNLPEPQQKEIENTLSWSLKKVAEKGRQN